MDIRASSEKCKFRSSLRNVCISGSISFDKLLTVFYLSEDKEVNLYI